MDPREVIKVFQRNLLEQREQIQKDLICILDGLDDKVVENACQVIVDRFHILLEKLKNG